LNTSQNYDLVTKKAKHVLDYTGKCVSSRSNAVYLPFSLALVEVCAVSRVLSPALASPVQEEQGGSGSSAIEATNLVRDCCTGHTGRV